MGIMAAEGVNGFYKSLVPLWGRQIPYTMMKFACFEKTVVALYQYVVPKPRDQCSKSEQLMVTLPVSSVPLFLIQLIMSFPSSTRTLARLLEKFSRRWVCGMPVPRVYPPVSL